MYMHMICAPKTHVHTPQLRQNPPLVCAHGGDGSHASPNTVEGHQHAINAGFRCSEVQMVLGYVMLWARTGGYMQEG